VWRPMCRIVGGYTRPGSVAREYMMVYHLLRETALGGGRGADGVDAMA
jgi:hypothetical protein